MTYRSFGQQENTPEPRPTAQEPIIVNGVRLDKMFVLPPETVFDPIPPDEHGQWLLRGVNVGALALNLIEGKNRINAADDLIMHAGHQHDEAVHTALFNTWPMAWQGIQLTQAGATRLRSMAGSIPLTHIPGLVLGVPRDLENRMVVLPGREAIKVIQEPVPFRDIDPYSQELLGNLFEIDLSQR